MVRECNEGARQMENLEQVTEINRKLKFNNVKVSILFCLNIYIQCSQCFVLYFVADGSACVAGALSCEAGRAAPNPEREPKRRDSRSFEEEERHYPPVSLQ